MPFDANNQPVNRKSGPNIKAKIIAALGRRDMSENEFLDLLIEKAVTEGGVCLQEVLKRYSPITKSTYEAIVIEDWPKDGTPIEKAQVVLDGMACGDIPADLGSSMIESISKSLGIEEITDLAKRLEAIEKLLDAQKA